MRDALSFQNTRALVIDSQKPTLDSTVRQLIGLGVTQVIPCRDLALARRALYKLQVDFVLCADEVDGSELTGQALLESLRRESVLSHTTVFVMLADQATYLSVMEAAEAALDSLLLRPFSASELADRLISARQWRRDLAPIFEAMQAGHTAAAVQHCLQRATAGGSYAELCMRMAAELLLSAGQTADALALFRQCDQDLPRAWSSLGVARAMLAQGEVGAARRQIEALLVREPEQPDALDILGRVLVEQGDLAGALAAFKQVLAVTPHCLLRLQHAGTLAYYLNQPELSRQLLERAQLMNKQSRLFDAMTLLFLALLQLERDDTKALGQTASAMAQYAARYPQSVRLQRMHQAVAALQALGAARPDQALQTACALAAQVDGDDFDLEAANILLALWVRLPQRQVSAGQQQHLVRHIALRFCVSRSATAVLMAAAQRSDAMAALLREGQAEVNQIAETALQQAVQGDAEAAVRHLLADGERTRNARLIGMAGQLLKRHGAQWPDHDLLLQQVSALQARHCRPITHLAGIRRSGRSSGGLVVRTRPMAPAADAAPLLPALDDTAESAT